MSVTLVRNCLFFPDSHGEIQDTWSLFADDANDAYRNRAVAWAASQGLDTLVMVLNHERKTSMFQKQYMGPLDMNKVNMALQFITSKAKEGWKIVPAWFDGPETNPKYGPILNQWDKHEAFIQAACNSLNPYVAGYLIGCETNRYFSTEQVEQLVAWTKKYSNGKPVGTHMCWKPNEYRLPANLDFLAYEFSWHPEKGDDTSAAECVREIQDRIAHAPGLPFWASEYNLNPSGSRIKEQSRALVNVNGVYGIGGPV